jgi:dTDP-D-glucose 4,6-dehydratase
MVIHLAAESHVDDPLQIQVLWKQTLLELRNLLNAKENHLEG